MSQEEPTYLDRVLRVSKAWRIFPCKDKRPLTPHGLKDATKDPDIIREWWEKWPDAQVGVPVGMNTGTFVLDVDRPNGPATLAALEKMYGQIPETCKARTPSGGLHYHFLLPQDVQLKNSAGQLGVDLDIRTDGGYVIVQPSPLYCWLTNGTKAAPAPEWLIKLLTPATPPIPASAPARMCVGTTAYGRKALDAECANIALAPEGTRNNVLNTAAVKIAGLVSGGEIDRSEAESSLAHAGSRAGMSETEVAKTIASGFKAGLQTPRVSDEQTRKTRKDEAEFVRDVRDVRDVRLVRERKELVRVEDQLVRVDYGGTSALVDEFIALSTGTFSVNELAVWAGIATPEGRNALYQVLLRRKKRNILESVAGKHGIFRRVESECEELDFSAEVGEPTDISLPFGMNKLVELMPGNIVVVAGEPNAGKTAFMLNLVRMNMHKAEVHYFNSEMGQQELGKRLRKFNMPISDWKFKAWERTDNFQDAIRQGEGVLNIIDFLEISENFYLVGQHLRAIHDKLDGAIAIVALQKNKGVDVGMGGGRSLEKPRLYLAMEPGLVRIVKAKNWAGQTNPNGLQRNFKLVNGCDIIPQDDWHPTPPKEEKQVWKR